MIEIGSKKIIIRYNISGTEIKLKTTVNIINNTLIELYYIIENEINKVNIASIIINEYLYTHKDYTKNYKSNLIDISCINRKLLEKFHQDNKKISTLLNKEYNEDYIEVLIMCGSYIPYIKKIIKHYSNYLDYYNYNYDYHNNNHNYMDYYDYYYDYYYDNDYKDEFDEKENKKIFIYYLSKLDNNCILSLNDYENIKSYCKYKFTKYNILEEYHEIFIFILNEIKKYCTI